MCVVALDDLARHCARGLPGQDHLYYHTALNSIHVDPSLLCSFPRIVETNIKSLGIPAGMETPCPSTDFSANDAKMFHGLQEIND